MGTVTVRTKEELDAAVKSNLPRIVVHGELAEKLESAINLKKYSKVAIAALGVALAAVPFTGGLSGFAALPIVALTGIELAVIVAVIAIGLALILLILSKYDKVRFKGKYGGAEAELELSLSDAKELTS